MSYNKLKIPPLSKDFEQQIMEDDAEDCKYCYSYLAGECRNPESEYFRQGRCRDDTCSAFFDMDILEYEF